MQQVNKSALESQLVATIQENLSLYLNENAIFLAERLVAEFPSEQNVYLLATCYHRSQQTFRAYHLLKGLNGPQSRYLFAVCCIELGKLTEAESALLPNNNFSLLPNGAAGYYLMGKVFQLSNRHQIAPAYFQTALRLDPMMWCAYEELCALGADREATEFINAPESVTGTLPEGTGGGPTAPRSQTQPAAAQPGTAEPASGFTFAAHTPPNQVTDVGISGHATPMLHTKVQPPKTHRTAEPGPEPMSGAPQTAAAAGAGEEFITPEASDVASGPPPMLQRGPAAGWPSTSGVPTTNTPTALPGWLASGGSALPQQQQQRKFLDDGKMRKISSKLFADPASALRQSPGGAMATTGGRIGSAMATHYDDNLALLQAGAVHGVPKGERSVEGQAAAVGLLQLLGEGYRLLSMYKCQEAIDAISRLPANHLHTGWALIQLGRAYFEMVDYNSAALAFEQARKIDPYRLKGLEVYSTVLWHMKREVELSALAQEAVALDRLSPPAWCIMGNCFSLQKEHEAALRFFQRALQLRGNLPYAFTLCGHEFFTNEDFESGITCYRSAIRVDPRHYNAWFGMGHIYYRQEKYGMAEYHFRRAFIINERSSVLRCYLGMALHKLKRSGEAMQMLRDAIAADPRNPLARFELANVLVAEGHFAAGLQELRALHNVAPKEASVLFHMGKLLKRLGDTQGALAAFSEALDLQPPSADTNVIKAAIDRVTMPDAEEEEEV